MTKEELHEEVVRLVPQYNHLRVIVHALIDLGVVTELACQYDECVLSDRSFQPRDGRKHHPAGLSLDHIIPRAEGGSDRPENVAIMHFACNSARGGRYAWTREGRREKHQEQMQRRWADPEQRKAQIKKVSKPRTTTENFARGDDHWTRTPEGRKKLKEGWKKRRAHSH